MVIDNSKEKVKKRIKKGEDICQRLILITLIHGN